MQGNNVIPANVTVTQIGTEGGFLQTPVALITAGVPNALAPFLLGPAERPTSSSTSRPAAGTKVILYNDAPAPFPAAPRSSTIIQATRRPQRSTCLAPAPTPGPSCSSGSTQPCRCRPSQLQPPSPARSPCCRRQSTRQAGRCWPSPGYPWTDPSTGKVYAYAGKVQNLTLNEVFDDHGRLMQLVGTTALQTFGLGLPIMPERLPTASSMPTACPQRSSVRHHRDLEHLQPDRRHTPDAFPPLQRQVLQRRAFNVRQFNAYRTITRRA